MLQARTGYSIENLSVKLGSNALNTNSQTITGAINEISKQVSNVNIQLLQSISEANNNLSNLIGNLDDLQTQDKSNIVLAINDIVTQVLEHYQQLGGVINGLVGSDLVNVTYGYQDIWSNLRHAIGSDDISDATDISSVKLVAASIKDATESLGERYPASSLARAIVEDGIFKGVSSPSHETDLNDLKVDFTITYIDDIKNAIAELVYADSFSDFTDGIVDAIDAINPEVSSIDLASDIINSNVSPYRNDIRHSLDGDYPIAVDVADKIVSNINFPNDDGDDLESSISEKIQAVNNILIRDDIDQYTIVNSFSDYPVKLAEKIVENSIAVPAGVSGTFLSKSSLANYIRGSHVVDNNILESDGNLYGNDKSLSEIIKDKLDDLDSDVTVSQLADALVDGVDSPGDIITNLATSDLFKQELTKVKNYNIIKSVNSIIWSGNNTNSSDELAENIFNAIDPIGADRVAKDDIKEFLDSVRLNSIKESIIGTVKNVTIADFNDLSNQIVNNIKNSNALTNEATKEELSSLMDKTAAIFFVKSLIRDLNDDDSVTLDKSLFAGVIFSQFRNKYLSDEVKSSFREVVESRIGEQDVQDFKNNFIQALTNKKDGVDAFSDLVSLSDVATKMCSFLSIPIDDPILSGTKFTEYLVNEYMAQTKNDIKNKLNILNGSTGKEENIFNLANYLVNKGIILEGNTSTISGLNDAEKGLSEEVEHDLLASAMRSIKFNITSLGLDSSDYSTDSQFSSSLSLAFGRTGIPNVILTSDIAAANVNYIRDNINANITSMDVSANATDLTNAIKNGILYGTSINLSESLENNLKDDIIAVLTLAIKHKIGELEDGDIDTANKFAQRISESIANSLSPDDLEKFSTTIKNAEVGEIIDGIKLEIGDEGENNGNTFKFNDNSAETLAYAITKGIKLSTEVNVTNLTSDIVNRLVLSKVFDLVDADYTSSDTPSELANAILDKISINKDGYSRNATYDELLHDIENHDVSNIGNSIIYAIDHLTGDYTPKKLSEALNTDWVATGVDTPSNLKNDIDSAIRVRYPVNITSAIDGLTDLLRNITVPSDTNDYFSISVGTDHIADDAVTSSKILSGSVTSDKLANEYGAGALNLKTFIGDVNYDFINEEKIVSFIKSYLDHKFEILANSTADVGKTQASQAVLDALTNFDFNYRSADSFPVLAEAFKNEKNRYDESTWSVDVKNNFDSVIGTNFTKANLFTNYFVNQLNYTGEEYNSLSRIFDSVEAIDNTITGTLKFITYKMNYCKILCHEKYSLCVVGDFYDTTDCANIPG